MQTRTLIDLVLARATDLGLKPAGQPQGDASAVELLLLYELQQLAESFDLDFLTVMRESLFVTQTGQRTYALPDDFGRFVTPRDDQESGLYLNDGLRDSPLRYRAPEDFFRQRAMTSNARPGYFTLTAGPYLMLDPPPDANGTTGHYTGAGVYVLAVTPDLFERDIPVAQAGCLVDMVLGTLALDTNHPRAELLLGLKAQARSRLLNGTARQRQQFQTKQGRLTRDSRRTFALR